MRILGQAGLGFSTPTAPSSSHARSSQARFGRRWLRRRPSVRKSPTVRSGLVWAQGSWKTIATSPAGTLAARTGTSRTPPAHRSGPNPRPLRRAAAGRRRSGRSSTSLHLTRRPARPTHRRSTGRPGRPPGGAALVGDADPQTIEVEQGAHRSRLQVRSRPASRSATMANAATAMTIRTPAYSDCCVAAEDVGLAGATIPPQSGVAWSTPRPR